MRRIIKADKKGIKLASKIIKNGGVIAFPTETVYGLGANVFNEEAIKNIFKIKKRPYSDPLIVHIYKKEQIKLLAKRIPQKLNKIIEIFWPGPLTIILEKKKEISKFVTGNLNTIAIRMPKNKIALNLIKEANTPIAAPSANLFKRLSPTKAIHVFKQLKNLPDLILDGGQTKMGLESTIIKYEKNKFYLLRAGSITIEDLEKKGKIKFSNNEKKAKIEAPGQFKKHYAPNIKLIPIDNEGKASDLNSAYISFKDKPKRKFKIIKILSKKGNFKEAAKNFYDFMHFLENKKINKIYIEKLPNSGLGHTIMDRIKRASYEK